MTPQSGVILGYQTSRDLNNFNVSKRTIMTPMINRSPYSELVDALNQCIPVRVILAHTRNFIISSIFFFPTNEQMTKTTIAKKRKLSILFAIESIFPLDVSGDVSIFRISYFHFFVNQLQVRLSCIHKKARKAPQWAKR